MADPTEDNLFSQPGDEETYQTYPESLQSTGSKQMSPFLDMDMEIDGGSSELKSTAICSDYPIMPEGPIDTSSPELSVVPNTTVCPPSSCEQFSSQPESSRSAATGPGQKRIPPVPDSSAEASLDLDLDQSPQSGEVCTSTYTLTSSANHSEPSTPELTDEHPINYPVLQLQTLRPNHEEWPECNTNSSSPQHPTSRGHILSRPSIPWPHSIAQSSESEADPLQSVSKCPDTLRSDSWPSEVERMSDPLGSLRFGGGTIHVADRGEVNLAVQTSNSQQQKQHGSADPSDSLSHSPKQPMPRSPSPQRGSLPNKHHLQNPVRPPNMESPISDQGSSSSVTAFLTSSTGANLFHLMDIASDRQELSYVEKILPREQIVAFCHTLNAESTRESRDGGLSLSFEKLDESVLNVVGFYGSKKLLTESFKGCNAIVVDDQIYSQMYHDSLSPGLYALLHKGCLIVFYWHKDEFLPNATRKDISCNFIRYLVDLCDSVFILLEGSGQTIREGLRTGTSVRTVRQNRTRQMRIEKKRATENKLELISGFSQVELHRSLPRVNKSSAGQSRTFWMCHGSQCGLLSCSLTSGQKIQHKLVETLDLEVSSRTQMFHGKSVDFSSTELKDEDLALFLEHSGHPAGTTYLHHLEDSRKKKNNRKDTQNSSRTKRFKEYEGKVAEALKDVVTEFLKTARKFAWEEALQRQASITELDNMLMSNSEQPVQRGAPPNPSESIISQVGKSLISGTQVMSRILGIPTKSRDFGPPDFRTKDGDLSVEKLESDIFTGFGRFHGQSIPHRFIFPYNRVTIRPLNVNSKNQYISTQTYMVRGSGGNNAGPLCLTDQLSFMPVHSKSKYHHQIMMFYGKGGKLRRPIITNTSVSGCKWSGSENKWGDMDDYLLQVVDDDSALGGLKDWVASEADRIPPLLGQKASFLSVVDNGDWSVEDIRHFLQLPVDRFLDAVLERPIQWRDHEYTDAHIRQMWDDIVTGATKSTVLKAHIVRECSAVYRSAREELLCNFQSLFEESMKELLELWIKYEDHTEMKDLEKRLEEERRSILRMYRQNQVHREQSFVKLLTCKFRGAGQMFVTYDESISGTAVQLWQVEELSCLKHDLEEIERNPSHTFNPKCEKPLPVLRLDPSTERLLFLAFLPTRQYLAFIQISNAEMRRSCHVSLIAANGKGTTHLRVFDHGYDLIAFDDQTRLLALYDKPKLIKFYRFEEGYKRLATEYSFPDVDLTELEISVTWMKFIPGRDELVFIDSDNKVWVFEMANRRVRAKEIQLPGRFLKAEVTKRGPCLLIFNESIERNHHQNTTATTTLQMDVYWIDKSMSHVSRMPVHTFGKRKSKDEFEIAVRKFGGQEHLLICTDLEDGNLKLRSQILKITSASDEYQMFSETATSVGGSLQLSSGLALDYLYYVYEKFSTNPPLAKQWRTLSFYVVTNEQDLEEECLKYLQFAFNKLQTEKGKNFHGLEKQYLVRDVNGVSMILADLARKTAAGGLGKQNRRTRSMGEWIRQLLCLVPIQIARAENNCLKPMADGLELPEEFDYNNTVSLTTLLRFGFYEPVFASWRDKPVKIISSMGKQSSGKSYLLNHLTGSLLDVSGGRCTDGVWMTVRFDDSIDKACMYVLLDFEGVDTFERSEQEDMLLSVLNAAISTITLYNQKDFNLDRGTDTVFQRFQNGVSLVQPDDKLFKGLFCIAVKDVGEEAVEDLDNHLKHKIQMMLQNSQENFLTKMYGGKVTLNLLAPFDTTNYYADIDQIHEIIVAPELKASYMDGRSFSKDLKLLIAQLSAKDWTSMDSKRIELRVHQIRLHLNTAISMGRLTTKCNEVDLVNFDTEVKIEDPSVYEGHQYVVNDTGLKLTPSGSDDCIGDILASLQGLFQRELERNGEEDESWHNQFTDFLQKLAERRTRRVLQWIDCNTQMFQHVHHHDEFQSIKLEATALCAELRQKLYVCSCTCKKCYLRCTKEKGHTDDHCCLGEHVCVQRCSYCRKEHELEEDEDADDTNINKCNDAAGHQGLHDCKSKTHTCKAKCVYDGQAGNCNRNCAKLVSHLGEHLCNSRGHKCSKTCSLQSCSNPCITPFELDHDPHACHEKFCPMPCKMTGCNRMCESKDHFHDNEPNVEHFCGMTHPCSEKCEARGNCSVQQDLIKSTKTFVGKFGTYEYEYGAEQSGIRKPCCVEIPPFRTMHEGPHLHTLKENVVHLCDTKCQACGYFCTEPIDHDGLHNTIHGNMRDTSFAAESEKIEFGDRVYAWGESGAAEMCNMHCKKQGRGHTHLVLCPTGRSPPGVCYSNVYLEGVQHEERKYGPNFDVPKDEMTHAAYWAHMQFLDPCSQEDQALFNLCGHECQSDEHSADSSKNGQKGKSQKSFCTLEVLHKPVSHKQMKEFTRGYVSRDGHHMDCKHELSSNVVFVIDRSASMGSDDITPQYPRFQKTHNNRLGCVFEAIQGFGRKRYSMVLGQDADLASVILFNGVDPAVTAVELELVEENILEKLLTYHPEGGTFFSTGLKQAERILLKSRSEGDQRPPVVIFLSDGANFDSDVSDTLAIIQSMRTQFGTGLQIFTVKFGSQMGMEFVSPSSTNSIKSTEELLRKMADEGKFYVSMDRLMLSDTFTSIATSLRPQAAALLVHERDGPITELRQRNKYRSIRRVDLTRSLR